MLTKRLRCSSASSGEVPRPDSEILECRGISLACGRRDCGRLGAQQQLLDWLLRALAGEGPRQSAHPDDLIGNVARRQLLHLSSATAASDAVRGRPRHRGRPAAAAGSRGRLLDPRDERPGCRRSGQGVNYAVDIRCAEPHAPSVQRGIGTPARCSVRRERTAPSLRAPIRRETARSRPPGTASPHDRGGTSPAWTAWIEDGEFAELADHRVAVSSRATAWQPAWARRSHRHVWHQWCAADEAGADVCAARDRR